MKWMKHTINVVVWTLIGIYTLLMVAFRTSYVQHAMGEAVASAIAEKLGTRVEVGRVDLGFLNRVIIDDAIVYDQQGKPLLRSARLSAKIELLPLLREGKVAITSAQVFGARLSLYQANATAKPNYQFALDSLASKDTTSKSSLNLRVNSFIMRHGAVSYDRLDLAPTHGKLNPAHLSLTDINANVSLRALTPDTLNAHVRKLSFKEQSGLTVERLTFHLEGGRHGAALHDFTLRLPHSTLSIPTLTASYKLTPDNKLANGSLAYNGTIGQATFASSDFGWLLPSLRKADATLNLKATLNGTDTSARLTTLTLHGLGGNVTLDGSAQAWGFDKHVEWNADIHSLLIAKEAWPVVAELADTEQPPIVARLGDIRLMGTVGGSQAATIEADCMATTAAGTADAAFTLHGDKSFKANILAKDIALGTLTESEQLGNLTAALELNGSLADTQRPDIKARGTIDHLAFKGYDYTGMELDIHYTPTTLDGTLAINDPNLSASFQGSGERSGHATTLDLTAHVGDLCPSALHLSDKWGDARFSGSLTAQGSGPTAAAATGRLKLTDFALHSSDTDYTLSHLDIASGNEGERQFVTLNADFGHAEIVGRFDHSTVTQSLFALIDRHLPSLRGQQKAERQLSNDFLVNAELWRTDWLEKVLKVPFRSSGTLTLTGKVDDLHSIHYLNGSAPSIDFGGQHLEDARLALTSTNDALRLDASLTRVTKGDRLKLALRGEAQNDSLAATASWDNTSRKPFSGTLNTVAHITTANGHPRTELSVKPSHLDVDGKTWQVAPSHVAIQPHHISVGHFSISHADQHLTIDGTASNEANDSLTVDLKGIDLAYVLNLVNFHSVDFGGQASGRAYVTTPFTSLGATAQLSVKDFTFEDGRLGTLKAAVDWNKEEKRIDIHATANDGPAAMTYIDGYVSPSPGYIDLGIHAAGTPMGFMRSLTSSFLSDIDGQANGTARVVGPLSAINLEGKLTVDGHLTVESTGCTYYLKGDTVTMQPNLITLDHAPFTDGMRGQGTLTGEIRHKNLSRISCDLRAEADNLLAYDFKDFGDDTFYGTVYGTGTVGIKGGGGQGIYMDVALTPQPGSSFVYNVSDPDAVASQEFIRWNDGTTHHDTTSSTPIDHIGPIQEKSDTRIDFAINMTPDATIRLLMDSKTGDYITLQGRGAITANYYNKGSFDMYGTYNVTGGTYGITIQNIIKKYFQFNDGGTITFRGDPYEAELNLQAVYTVNGVSLSDLNIGSSFTGNTIRVNCLMNITGQPNSPTVDFDMDLPTVSTDEKQMIRSIINSEDEMNQQVLYLLGIGRFYPQGANNATAQDERQQDQTSLAMQSLLSGTLSSQLNSVLSQVIKSNNWNFGANISTGDEGWNNAEYEGLLSGRLLNNRLLFNGQFGYRDNATTANTSFIGDFDIRYLLLPNGNLALKMYNQTNDRYFTKSSLNTQGIGLIVKRDFNGLGDLFGKKKKKSGKKNEQ